MLSCLKQIVMSSWLSACGWVTDSRSRGSCTPARQHDHKRLPVVGWRSAADEASDQFICSWRVQKGDVLILPSGRTSRLGVDIARAGAIRHLAPSEKIRWDQRDGGCLRWTGFLEGLQLHPHSDCLICLCSQSWAVTKSQLNFKLHFYSFLHADWQIWLYYVYGRII